MYLLSQGELSEVDTSDGCGSTLLSGVDSESEACVAYEKVPDCIDLAYEPGSVVSWDEVIGNARRNWRCDADKTTQIVLILDSEIRQVAPDWAVGDHSGTFQVERYKSGENHPGGTDLMDQA